MNIVKLAMEGQLDQECECLSMEEIDSLQEQSDAIELQFTNDLDETEKTMRVVGALEDLAFIAASEEKITPREAALIQVAADASVLNTGTDASLIFPAMEDITSGKAIADRIKEVVKRILAEIARILVIIRNKIKEFLDSNARLIKQRRLQIKSLTARAEKLEDSDSTTTFKSKPLYSVDIDGDVKTYTVAANIIHAIAMHVEASKRYLINADERIRSLIFIVGNFYKAVEKDNKPLLANYASILSSDRSISSFGKLDGATKITKGFEITGNLLNGGVITVQAGESAVSTDASDTDIAQVFLENFGACRTSVSSKSIAVDPVKMNSMTRNDVMRLLKHCTMLVEHNDAVNKTLAARQNDITALVRVIEKSAELSSLSGDLKSKLPYLNITTSVVKRLEAIPVNGLANLQSLNSKVIAQAIRLISDSIGPESDKK